MTKSKNTLSKQQNLEDLINEQNLLIFDEKNWVWKDLWKISEVTYSYDEKTKINTTLFVNWWWLNLETYKKSWKKSKRKLLLSANKKLVSLLNEKKEQIRAALNEVELLDIFSEDKVRTDKKSIFINSLTEKCDFIDYCLKSLIFELEKAWIENSLSEDQEEKLESKIQKLDAKLYGWDIKDNKKDTIASYEYIKDKYDEFKDSLTETEQKRFELYLDKINPFLSKSYKYEKKEKAKSIAWDFLDLKIPKSDYILWFNILVEALEKLEHIVESNEDVKSISDWPKWVQFPTTEKFEDIKISRFLKLGQHEIETHNVTDHNWRQLLWNLRWAKSTEKDEWVAILMEQIFMYWEELYKIDADWDSIIDITKVYINSNFIKTLMWELLNDAWLIDFLELSEKIDPDVISPIDRFYRLKRNNKKHVQHKDTTYTRWLFKAIDEINLFIKTKWKKWINPEDLFIGKISFEETEKLKNIKKEKIKKWEKIEMIKPLFISDAVYYVVNEKLKWNDWNITWDKFYNYLKNKYQIFQFSRELIAKVSYKTKRNVYGIVDIILKNIWKQQIESIISTKETTNKMLLNIVWWYYNPKIQNVRAKMNDESRKNAI